MTIQTNLHAIATAGGRDSGTVISLISQEELGVQSSEFERLLPPSLTASSQTQSESSLGENVPVFHERLTQARPTRWYGIND